jgi:hypothetical protein
MPTMDTQLKRISVMAKQAACMELMNRVRDTCLGMDVSGWAFNTGRIFGEYLKELQAQEALLNDQAK